MGRSAVILKVFDRVRKIAAKDVPVLIVGEAGTYREVVARAIHEHSPRHGGPFVPVNCSTIPAELARAELFGTGASPVGASSGQRGKIFDADGGTLFIENIAGLDASLVNDLTGIVREKEVRLNAHTAIRVDVRLIGTALDRPGIAMQGRTPGGVLKELGAVLIRIPPLRERKDDILPLVHYVVEETVRKFDTGPKELSKEAKEYLLGYDWPGNVRELEQMVKRATILSSGRRIEKKDLMIADIGSCSMREFLEEKLKRYLKEMIKLETCHLYDTIISEAERALIGILLRETGGNQVRAAKTLGINRNTLRSKIKQYKIRS